MLRASGTVSLWLALAPTLLAADLTQIDRKIVKQPAYQSAPKYALLVFGPEAKTRVWLVQDGETLYVDRNGNGDLTEAGKAVAADKNAAAPAAAISFKIGDFREGALLHKGICLSTAPLDHMADSDDDVKALLAKNPKAKSYQIFAEIEMPGRRGTGLDGRVRQYNSYSDANGILQFADNLQEAPIIHLGGPLQIALWSKHTLVVGRESDVILGVGTPGHGPGTMAWMDYDGVIPDAFHPSAEFTFLPKQPNAEPVLARFVLTHRC